MNTHLYREKCVNSDNYVVGNVFIKDFKYYITETTTKWQPDEQYYMDMSTEYEVEFKTIIKLENEYKEVV